MNEIPPQGAASTRCWFHPENEAVARCVHCGRALCEACRVILGGRNSCRWCASQVQRQVFPSGYQPVPQHGYQPSPYQGFPPGAYGQYYQGYGYPYAYPAYYPPQRPYRKPREVVFPGTPWGVGEAVIIFIIAFMSASTLTVSFFLVFREYYNSLTGMVMLIFLSSVVLYSLLLGGTYYSVRARHRSTLSALGLKFDGLGKGVVFGLGAGLPLFAVAIGIGLAIEYIYRELMGPSNPDITTKAVSNLWKGEASIGLLVVLVIVLCVLAPICEEIFFRGYLYPALRNRMSMQPAMILNGIMFAAAHFEVLGFLPRFLLGYGLCYMFEKNHNLSGPVTGHALYNSLVLLASWLL